MKVLVISNFYPPYYVGGYELGCRDVVEGLKARGHDVRVLTSTYGIGGPRQSDGVYRWLTSDFTVKDQDSPGFFGLMKRELASRRAFRELCTSFRPDVIYVWNATHISLSVIFSAQEMGYPICYFVSDYWLCGWESDSWYSLRARKPRRIHRRLIWRGLSSLLTRTGLLPESKLDLSHVQFASQHLKQAVLQVDRPVADADVIYWGVDTSRFPYNSHADNDQIRLLYVGQLIPSKGVRTAVEAARIIREQGRIKDATLTIVGGPDYDGQVGRLISSLGLDDGVRLTGLVPREQLPQIYQGHNILVFPSVWDEPFSITLLEAMSSGLAVVGTRTGGSAEILADEVNSLVFEKEDAHACADKILRLAQDPGLFNRLRQNARLRIEKEHNLGSMLDRIERSLEAVAGKRGDNGGNAAQ